MANSQHELLFLVAKDLVELGLKEKLNIGLRLKILNISGFLMSEKVIEETIFIHVCKNGMLPKLVKEIQRVKCGES